MKKLSTQTRPTERWYSSFEKSSWILSSGPTEISKLLSHLSRNLVCVLCFSNAISMPFINSFLLLWQWLLFLINEQVRIKKRLYIKIAKKKLSMQKRQHDKAVCCHETLSRTARGYSVARDSHAYLLAFGWCQWLHYETTDKAATSALQCI